VTADLAVKLAEKKSLDNFYFSNKVKHNPVETNMEEYQDSQEGIHLPTVDEMEKAIDKLNNNKAPGPHNINVELIKSSKPVLINILQEREE
jgi:hypothetical protein